VKEDKTSKIRKLNLNNCSYNRNNKLLLETIYRSERMLDYSMWNETFEILLAYMTAAWDGAL